MIRTTVIAVLLLVSACAPRGEIGLSDVSVVEAPVYSANKVLFLNPPARQEDGRITPLAEGYELVDQLRRNPAGVGLRRSVKNRQPLSIVVSRAYVPGSVTACLDRASDALFGGGRDIAVLLDISTKEASQEFIAVWYERNVKADALLSFQDLLVYSSDAWDAKYPPYFRLRLVDVSAERNTAVGALLEQVRGASNTITTLASVPGAGAVVNIAALAARHILGNDRNRALVDFTFQLYGEHLLSEAGGVPLGVLQTGGIIVTAPPCDSGNDFWNNSLTFDHRLSRVQLDGQSQAMPYIFATILTADLSVPQIVRTRSAAILKRLTDPQVAQSEIEEALKDVGRLDGALRALNAREVFRRRPSKGSFATLVTDAAGSYSSLDATEQSFFLNSFYQVTGVSLTTAAEYKAWLDRCSGPAKFDAEAARFEVKTDVKDANGEPCWPE